MTVARGALARTESRGAHYRTDYPLRNDRDWLNRTLVTWAANASDPVFSYEPTGIIDLPPGYRGYGADERIEMTATLEEHNADVVERQARQGRRPTAEEMGTRLRRGAWQDVAG